MRFFIALAVFAVGMGLYAAAALMFDRRHVLHGWRAARRARAGDSPEAAGRASVAVRAASTLPPSVLVLGLVVIGTLLMLGSCAGLIVW
ncbi:hypothetical protein ACNTMW_31360 [Planosporangium sp. 12N6]|uniref:hypothetical protein n=1 Tax=Planosporangium spinosum TaxID=3402278 RepID=UPI003CFB4443